VIGGFWYCISQLFKITVVGFYAFVSVFYFIFEFRLMFCFDVLLLCFVFMICFYVLFLCFVGRMSVSFKIMAGWY